MARLIDASVVIAAERGRLDLELMMAPERGEYFAVSAITASELLHGVYRAINIEQRSRRRAFVEHILERVPVIAFDLGTARVHARISAELSSKGIAIGQHDLLIAATALARGYGIITRDERSFPRVRRVAGH